jgi:hypothetical protein
MVRIVGRASALSNKKPARARAAGGGLRGVMNTPSVAPLLQPVNSKLRQRCPACYERFVVPIVALSLDRPIACRGCGIVSPLSLEPPDDRWWQYVCAPEVQTRARLLQGERLPEPVPHVRPEPLNGHHDERDLLAKVLG